MLRLAAASLRARKGGFAAALIALTLAVTLTTACGILLETGLRGGVAPERYAAAPIIVTGDQQHTLSPQDPDRSAPSVSLAERVRVPADLAGVLAGVPGVGDALVDVSFPVTVVDGDAPAVMPPGAPLQGHPWASAALAPVALRSGRAPATDREVVLTTTTADRAGVTVGDRVELRSSGITRSYEVTGIAVPAGGDAGGQAPVFFADEAAARRSADPGMADAIGLLMEPGADRDAVRRRVDALLRDHPAAGSAVTVTGNDRAAAESLQARRGNEDLTGLAGTFGGLALIVAAFVVASTFALSVFERRRELALLRAVGTTPRQAGRLVTAEAVLVALVATAFGAAPGVVLAHGLARSFAMLGVIPAGLQLRVGPVPMLVAAGAGVLVAVLASLAAGRRAARTRPAAALGEAVVERRSIGAPRLAFGLVLAAVSVTLTVVSLSLEGDAAGGAAAGTAMTWIIALALLGPLVTRPLVTLLAVPVRAFGGTPGYLATAAVRANSRRFASAVIPLMLAVGLASTTIFIQTTQTAAARETSGRALTVDSVVTAAAGGLDPGALEQVRAVPGVQAATAVARSSVICRCRPEVPDPTATAAQGLTADSATATLDLGVTAGNLAALRGDAVALAAGSARSLGAGIGDTVPLVLGDGTQTTLRVVAVYAGGLGTPPVTLPLPLLLEHTTTELAGEILVRYNPAADRDATHAMLERVAEAHSGLLLDRAAHLARQDRQQAVQASVNYLIAGVVLLYTAIAVVNTLVMATLDRRRELALLRLTGATRRTLLRAMACEGLLVTACGALLGSLAAAGTLIPASQAVRGTVLPAVDPWVYAGLLLTVGSLTMGAVLLPARRALREHPADLLTS